MKHKYLFIAYENKHECEFLIFYIPLYIDRWVLVTEFGTLPHKYTSLINIINSGKYEKAIFFSAEFHYNSNGQIMNSFSDIYYPVKYFLGYKNITEYHTKISDYAVTIRKKY